jgi:hypothetical protein
MNIHSVRWPGCSNAFISPGWSLPGRIRGRNHPRADCRRIKDNRAALKVSYVGRAAVMRNFKTGYEMDV